MIQDGFTSSWAQYTIRLKNERHRNGLQAYLKENGVPSMVYYAKPLHEQKAFSKAEQYTVDLRITQQLCKTVLSLPMHPYMDADDIKRVIDTIILYGENGSNERL